MLLVLSHFDTSSWRKADVIIRPDDFFAMLRRDWVEREESQIFNKSG
jgi:hypothetical protein